MDDSNIIIPIGSSCSVAYQLQSLNKRHQAFPFDWVRIKRLKTITKIIGDNFDGYSIFHEIKKVNSFPLLDDDLFDDNGNKETFHAKNIYNTMSYHDFSSKESFDSQIDIVKEKYERRIDRFYEVLKSGKKITFIRDEHCPQKLTTDDINDFISVILNINSEIDFRIIIVCHNPNNIHTLDHITMSEDYKDKVIIKNDTNSFEDWKRPNVEWDTIFS